MAIAGGIGDRRERVCVAGEGVRGPPLPITVGAGEVDAGAAMELARLAKGADDATGAHEVLGGEGTAALHDIPARAVRHGLGVGPREGGARSSHQLRPTRAIMDLKYGAAVT